MRLLQGSKIIDAPDGWREQVLSGGRPVVIDVGAGDGRFAYESARSDPASLYVAVEPNAGALAEYAYRASRKPARGGVDNALFIVASAEALPGELRGLASRVRVNFPWGSLLRSLLEPDASLLRSLLSLLERREEHERLEIVVSYDPGHDTGAFAGEPLPPLDPACITSTLIHAYEAAGAEVVEHRRLTQDEAIAIPSTWGRRLLHARPREVYWLTVVPAASR